MITAVDWLGLALEQDQSVVKWVKENRPTATYLLSLMTYGNLTFATDGKVLHIYHKKLDGYTKNSIIGSAIKSILSDAGDVVAKGGGTWGQSTRLSDGNPVIDLELGGDTATINRDRWVKSCNGEDPHSIVSIGSDNQFNVPFVVMMFQDRSVIVRKMNR